MKIFFWQNMPSHHQAPSLQVLSDLWPDEVYGIWCADTSAHRKQLGWQKPHFGNLREVTLPTSRETEAAIQLIEKYPQDIHVFGGFHAYGPIVDAYRHAVRCGLSNLAIMAEPGVIMGWKGLLRPIRAKWFAREYIHHIRLFLAKGQHGVEFYRNAGFDSKILFPYMYQSEIRENQSYCSTHTQVKLVYVGEFIRRKGVDIMIRALIKCREYDWKLTIIGDGKGIEKIKNQAEAGGIANRIQWLGVQPNTKIIELLSRNDVCLIPSRFEGWGVVTNEAIQTGLAVICSDKATSRELIETSGAGNIFHSGDSSDLARCIKILLTDHELISAMKQKAIEYRHRIAPRVIGQYLNDVLTYVFLDGGDRRPFPPWLDEPYKF